jgi:DNA polymerase-3 subunit epsilon
MILTDQNGKSLSKFSSLIKPDGWKISEGAQKVHGITDELCEKYGIKYHSAVGMFFLLAKKATKIIAHNEEFDRNMLAIEAAYYQKESGSPYKVDAFNWFCTMKSNTHIKGGKWPKLAEAYKHYTGKELGDDAHDALVDAEGCKEIYFAMNKKEAA